MCSIFGAVGPYDRRSLQQISDFAKDRGRDGGRYLEYDLANGDKAAIGNWRATPTTESADTDPQPYDGVVHNGTIANDRELGNPEGVIDSRVLPAVLDRSSIYGMAQSLTRIKGSYAIAAVSDNTVYLACNYKPLYYYRDRKGAVYFSSMERHLRCVCEPGTRPAKLEPYSVIDLATFNVVYLPRKRTNKTLVICSAGLDSTVVAAQMIAQGRDVSLLHYRYGCQAGTREERAVTAIARALNTPLYFLDLDYSKYRGTSPLFGKAEDIASGIAGSEYAHEWVPARNLVMLANAVAFAEANGFDAIALGNNLEESGAYPDNEEEFTHLLDGALDYAVQEGGRVRLLAPVGHLMKHEIVALGKSVNAPLHLTWSCYRGGEHHCGECGPCYMRKTAFYRNGLIDPVMEAGQ